MAGMEDEKILLGKGQGRVTEGSLSSLFKKLFHSGDLEFVVAENLKTGSDTCIY